MRIVIQTIPHNEQRYDTAGDWQWEDEHLDNPVLKISVSETGNWKYNMLVAQHELHEALVCLVDRVDQKDVDDFDLSHAHLADPGRDPDAPYHFPHMYADALERQMALNLCVEWDEYEKTLDNLVWEPKNVQ